jgi:hypothetical protein
MKKGLLPAKRERGLLLGKEFVHLPLNEEVRSVSGGYVLEKEVRLPFEGRELLYIVGTAVVDTACCGTGGIRYALVPGFVEHWQGSINENNRPVSQVLRVEDNAQRAEISRIIRSREPNIDVQFL